MIINVGGINQPFPLLAQDCSSWILVLSGIELHHLTGLVQGIQANHMIINVGGINQPFPLLAQDCSSWILVLSGIELHHLTG